MLQPCQQLSEALFYHRKNHCKPMPRNMQNKKYTNSFLKDQIAPPPCNLSLEPLISEPLLFCCCPAP